MTTIPRWEHLPHPSEIEDAVKYESIGEFQAAGGAVRVSDASPRWIVSMSPAGYHEDIPGAPANAIQAMELAWMAFDEDGGWTMFVWDCKEQVGWAYPTVGPEWTRYLYFKDRNSPGARKFRQNGVEVKTNVVKKKVAKKKAKKKVAKKKATKKKTGGTVTDIAQMGPPGYYEE